MMIYTQRTLAGPFHGYGARPGEFQAPSIFDSIAPLTEKALTTTDLQHPVPAPVPGADGESLAIPAAAALIDLTPPSGPILNDAGLAAELARLARGQDEVLVIANAYTVCMRHRPA